MKIEGPFCRLQITESSDMTNLVSHDASLSEVHVNVHIVYYMLLLTFWSFWNF